MLNLTLDLDTGLAKLAVATTIKVGAPVPVIIHTVRGATPSSPGASPLFELGLGTDASPPVLKAYLADFEAENAQTFSGVLDANDARLVEFMAGKGQVAMGCEIAWTVGGDLQVTPTFPIPVQPRIITGPASSEGGPYYYTEAEVDALLLGVHAGAPFDRYDLTALTGGTATDLDGVDISEMAVGSLLMLDDPDTGALSAYRLTAPVAITAISTDNPSVVTAPAHGLPDGGTSLSIRIGGTNSTPSIDGDTTVDYVDNDTFLAGDVAVVTVSGTTGYFSLLNVEGTIQPVTDHLGRYWSRVL